MWNEFRPSCRCSGKELAQENYIKIVKDAGFDHIRLPFKFDLEVEGLKPNADYYERIKATAKMATDMGLYAIIDIHPLVGMKADLHGMKHHLYKLWEELSAYLKDADERLFLKFSMSLKVSLIGKF